MEALDATITRLRMGYSILTIVLDFLQNLRTYPDQLTQRSYIGPLCSHEVLGSNLGLSNPLYYH